ncbi:hypothetical protein [Melittangium boletus]|uniref:hypothetical protein n=1 Tax=Melittangium boletus TaxID=83453 RepID=UPI003DA46701
MGVIWSPLVLVQPNAVGGSKVEFPRLPSGVSRQIEEGTRVLDAGLFIGEKLGLELSELSACLNRVWLAPPHRGRGVFIDDDIPVLVEGYARIQAALRAAIDEQGRPLGPGGARLKAATGIEQYPDGGLVTCHRPFPLVDLLDALDVLLPFLRFAQEHMLFMTQGEWSTSETPES